MEDIYYWSHMEGANEHYRGANGRGDGVHILTGPIFVEEAQPGDLLKVEILDLKPRKNPKTAKTYGSNAAAWWGFQARVKMADGSDFKAGTFTDTPVSIYRGRRILCRRFHVAVYTIYKICFFNSAGFSYHRTTTTK